MVFSSLPFICFFLPAVFLLHLVIRNQKARNLLLTLASLVFYAWGEPVYVLLLLGSAALNYGTGRLLAKQRRGILALGIIVNIGLLAVFKYAGFLVQSLNALLPEAIGLPVPALSLPIGISFYTFQSLSYLIDVYRGETAPQKNFFSLLLYISFFPQLIAGPIVKYHDIERQITERSLTAEGMSRGLMRFSLGLAKKVLLANTLALAADGLYALPPEELGTLGAWLAAVSFLLQLYFDFSGYSDMAIGLAGLFGFSIRENFNYPFISSSCSEFWRRWHISLNSWFREYLYFQLGGSRKGKARTLLNLWIVFFLTGLWHGAAWTFVVWGLYHGFFIILERFGLVPFVKNKVLGTVYTAGVMVIGFIFFRADTLSQAVRVIAACFGYGAQGGAAYALLSGFASPYFLLIFGLALLFSTPVVRILWRKGCAAGRKKERADLLIRGGAMLLSLLLLLLCLMQLASDSYDPFIYFRF